MENTPQGPNVDPQAEIDALKAQLAAEQAAHAAEMAAKQEALDAILATHADLMAHSAKTDEKVQATNDAVEAAKALFAANTAKNAGAEDDTKEQPGEKQPVVVTDVDDKPSGVKIVNKAKTQTPPPTNPTKRPEKRRPSNKLTAALVIGALAVGGLFGYGASKSDKDRGSDAPVAALTTTTETATTPAVANGNLGGDLANMTSMAAKQKAANEAAAAQAAKDVQAAKAANTGHAGELNRAFDANTVAGAVDLANPTAATVKGDIHAFADHAGTDKLDHSDGKMSSALSHFKAGEITSPEAALHAFDSALGSPAYAAKLYNELNGNHKSNVLPQGVTNEQALKSIEAKMTADGTKFNMRSDLTGLGLNHGQRTETGVFNANIMSLDGKEFLVITLNDGKEVLIKFENNCANVVDRIVIRQKQAPATPAAPAAPQAQKPKTPGHAVFQGPKTKPVTPGHVVTPKHPTPKPGEHPKPKHDDNTNPAGVQGEPGGQGGTGELPTRPQAGVAEPGVGQPQEQTPTPVTPAGGEATPTGPAETGVDPGTTGPAGQGTPGTGTPAGQINPGNTPAGE